MNKKNSKKFHYFFSILDRKKIKKSCTFVSSCFSALSFQYFQHVTKIIINPLLIFHKKKLVAKQIFCVKKKTNILFKYIAKYPFNLTKIPS